MNIDHLIVFYNLANLLFNSIFPLIPSLFLSLTHTLSHSLTLPLSLSLSYSDSLSLSHAHTHKHTHFISSSPSKVKILSFSFLLSYKFIENSPVFPHNHGSLSLERISEKSEKHFFFSDLPFRQGATVFWQSTKKPASSSSLDKIEVIFICYKYYLQLTLS